MLRAINIDKHFNSNYNILSGEERKVFELAPEKPKQFSHLD